MSKGIKTNIIIFSVIILTIVLFIFAYLFMTNHIEQEEISVPTSNVQEFVKIQADPNNIPVFNQEIHQYADQIADNLILENIELFYDQMNLSRIMLTYGENAGEKKASTLSITYDVSKGGIILTSLSENNQEGAISTIQELDVSKWEISFDDAINDLLRQLKEQGVTQFDRVGASCYENTIEYVVFINANDEYDQALQISVRMY